MQDRQTPSRRYGPLCLGTLLLAFGCAHDQTSERRVAKSMVVPETQPRAVYVPQVDSMAVLLIDDDVRDKCALPAAPSGDAIPDFDHAALRPRGETVLAQLAACLNEGALRDQGVTVIGHADPQGSHRVREDLGVERARTARDYLVKQGVASSAVHLESRSERDEGDVQVDRRVEIKTNSRSEH